MRNFVLRETRHLASLLQREKVARFTAADEVLLQYIAETNPISLCSHTDAHPNLNREVCHSLTWHSSESESALERFEPVAVVQQLLDGRGSVFALVAARRQKVFKRGIDTYAEHVCRRRRDGSQSIPLFVLFVLFGQAKRTLKDKYHKVTFLLSYFSSPKSTIEEPPHILTKSGFRAWYTAISRKPALFSISFAVPKSAARSRALCASEPRVIISPPSSR